jgi:hypothetical protein
MQHENESPVNSHRSEPQKGMSAEEGSEELLLDKLASGDRPALYATGMVAAQALKTAGVAVFMLDVLGRVHLMPAQFVEVKRRPKLSDDELNLFTEDEALTLLLKQGEEEDAIVKYMQRRPASHEGDL